MSLFKILIFLIFLILPLNLYAKISLNQCNEGDIKGRFNLIIYSNYFIDDPETFIILDKVDDQIKILPYAPAFKYKTIANLNEKKALTVADEILKSSSVSNLKCSVIYDEDNILGYELKPVYFPWIFGILEPVETTYKKENHSVIIFIRLNPWVERQIYFGGDSNREN